MSKAVLIGIIVAVIIVVVGFALSFDTIFIVEDTHDGSIETSSGNEEEKITSDSKPSGRNLSVEFEEKMGLSTP